MRTATILAAVVAAGVVLLAAPFGAAAQAPPPAAPVPAPPVSTGWTFSLTPYFWLPNIDGTLKYDIPPEAEGGPEVSVGPNDYLSNLDFVLMLAGDARRGRWSIATDVVYLDFSSEDGAVKSIDFGGDTVATDLNLKTQSYFKGLAWTVVGGYEAVSGPRGTLEVLGGVRYFGNEAGSDWQLSAEVGGPGEGQVFPASGSIEQDQDNWDAIAGVRGKIRLGDGGWSLPYYLDAGAGSSDLTWQGLFGVAYSFKWGDLRLSYRHIYYDQGDDKLVQDMRFSGPAFGALFRF